MDLASLFEPAYGTFVLELAAGEDIDTIADRLEAAGLADGVDLVELGPVTEDYALVCEDQRADLAAVQEAWERGIEDVFPYRSAEESGPAVAAQVDELVGELRTLGVGDDRLSWGEQAGVEAPRPSDPFAAPFVHGTSALPLTFGASCPKPRVVIPVFPGTNCEYDTAAAFERAGAAPDYLHREQPVSRSGGRERTRAGAADRAVPDRHAARRFLRRRRARRVGQADRVLLPRSSGDRGGARFAAEPRRIDAGHLQRVPGAGEAGAGALRRHRGPWTMRAPRSRSTQIGRHQSRIVRTRVASDHVARGWRAARWATSTPRPSATARAASWRPLRCWLSMLQGTARWQPSMWTVSACLPWSLAVNPNGSVLAIEGITSPDGRVLGKMGHTERTGAGLYRNIPGWADMPLFEAGVDYFA